MLVQARLVESTRGDQQRNKNEFPVGEVVLEGVNFGANPTVYFGKTTEPATLTEIGRSNTLDSVTLKLPQGTPAGTYKLVIQNTTGPFFDDDGEVNPIFCFGSVSIGYASRAGSS